MRNSLSVALQIFFFEKCRPVVIKIYFVRPHMLKSLPEMFTLSHITKMITNRSGCKWSINRITVGVLLLVKYEKQGRPVVFA